MPGLQPPGSRTTSVRCRGKAQSAFETLQRQQQAGDPKAEALLQVRGKTQELEAQYQANAQAGRDNSGTELLLAK